MWTRFNRWLRTLTSTNFKIVVGALLATTTALFYFASEIRCTLSAQPAACRPIDTTNFALWLAFVASWAGLTYRQLRR